MNTGLLAIGIVLVLLLLSQSGIAMAMALYGVSFFGFALLRGDFDVAAKFMAQATADSIASYEFSIIPLFVFMGLLVNAAGLGRDLYVFSNLLFRKVSGSLALATIWANAAFAAISGVSIASLAVFTNIAIPEMLRSGYAPKFSVGLVAGSSILGMLIPPSLLFILFGMLTEISIGDLFIAGIIPGVLLASVYSIIIIGSARLFPAWVFGSGGSAGSEQAHGEEPVGTARAFLGALPVFLLMLLILGGIYGGYMTATEAGAVGAFVSLLVAGARRRLTLASLLEVARETANITASICILIIAASFFSRVIALAGLPDMLSEAVVEARLGLPALLLCYIAVLLLLGMLSGAASVILITVPIFLPIFLQFPEVDLLWLGVVTVFAVEIGMITPPFGVAVFVIKTCLPNDAVPLGDIFRGAVPFTIILLIVLGILVGVPSLSLMLL